MKEYVPSNYVFDKKVYEYKVEAVDNSVPYKILICKNRKNAELKFRARNGYTGEITIVCLGSIGG